jgi:hypothetical protein
MPDSKLVDTSNLRNHMVSEDDDCLSRETKAAEYDVKREYPV